MVLVACLADMAALLGSGWRIRLTGPVTHCLLLLSPVCAALLASGNWHTKVSESFSDAS